MDYQDNTHMQTPSFLRLLPYLLLHSHEICFEGVFFLLYSLVIEMFFDEIGFLGRDFLLQLIDLMVHDFQLPLHFGDFVLSFDQVLRVQVPIRTNGFISAGTTKGEGTVG